MKLRIAGEGRVRMSLVVPAITGGSSDIKIAQREIIQLEDVVESIRIMSLEHSDDLLETTPERINYAFSTYLDSNTELIEASVIIMDPNNKIRTWIGEADPIIFGFRTPSSRNYAGLSLSIVLPYTILETGYSPNEAVFFITQPITNIFPVFVCYPYYPSNGLPILDKPLDEYTLVFSLLRRTV